MSVVVVTGSAGLIGSESVRYFSGLGLHIVGIDNNMRAEFFGTEASTEWVRQQLLAEVSGYEHQDLDIRDKEAVFRLFRRFGKDIVLVIHAAAQPSHDWAASDPITDFTVNANGTQILLEATRQFCSEAAFIFTSTNKVYGDRPNDLTLIECETRWELSQDHPYYAGIPEDMPVDACLHSLFGVSKLAADAMVQEYGKYFGMNTACFRGGCLTGPNHSGAQLHGFLAYLMRCAATNTPYQVFGYKAKQVRDNIHSLDLIRAFHEFFQCPRPGEVYNMGGGRFSNCSMLEAIRECEKLTGMPMEWQYVEHSRKGDHVWYISDLCKFRSHYPSWRLHYDVKTILAEIYERNRDRWCPGMRVVGA
jgi:CDP-paratose 2-epimerase